MSIARRLAVSKKRFSSADLRSLGEFLLDQKVCSNSDTYGRDVTKVRLSCGDGTEYESEDLKYFQDGAEIDIKSAESIRFWFWSRCRNREITVDLRHGASAGAITVVGDNDSDDWVTSVSSKLSERFDALQPSQPWFVRRSNLLWILLSCLFMLGLILFFYTLIRVSVALGWVVMPSSDAGLLSHIDGLKSRGWALASWWAIALIAASTVRDWILKAWPSIDLDTGPEHLRSEKLRRGRMGVFYGSVVVPIVWLLIARSVG